jgi:hypothetical protein
MHKFEVGQTGKCRGGDEYYSYKILATGLKLDEGRSIVAYITFPAHPIGFVKEFYENGGRYQGAGNDLDLLPPKQTVKFWMNVYSSGEVEGPYDTKSLADSCDEVDDIDDGEQRIACLCFERDFEPGEGLE